LDDLPEDAAPTQVRQAVDASVFHSCRDLGLNSLPVLLLHRWRHRASHQGAIWRRLLDLQSEGVIGLIGASVASPEEAQAALADPSIRHVQLPFNLLDHRWRRASVDRLAAQRPDVEIHARSVLLQGILAASPSIWRALPGASAVQIVERMDDWARRLGRANCLDLCLAFVRSQPWIHSLVIGFETVEQLRDLLGWFGRSALNAAQAEEVAAAFADTPIELLDPARWPAITK
jgi:spore coat polysaccharide biosynthesis protein SpsF